MKAKFPGKCSSCGRPICVGEEVRWRKGFGAWHPACPGPTEKDNPAESAYRVVGSPDKDCQGWLPGEVILTPEFHRQRGAPEYLVVIEAKTTYVFEDGCPNRRTRTYEAVCRAAMQEEIEGAALPARRRATAEEGN